MPTMNMYLWVLIDEQIFQRNFVTNLLVLPTIFSYQARYENKSWWLCTTKGAPFDLFNPLSLSLVSIGVKRLKIRRKFWILAKRWPSTGTKCKISCIAILLNIWIDACHKFTALYTIYGKTCVFTSFLHQVLYKSRCDNRLNEMSERAIANKRKAEMLAKKYEEKYKLVAEVASKLTIEEASFRDIHERKMELNQALVKMDQGGSTDGILQVRADLKCLTGENESSLESVKVVVSKLGELVDVYGRKVWLIGYAESSDVCMQFFKMFPRVVEEWDLHVLPIYSIRHSMAETYPKSSLMESFVPFGGFFFLSMPSDIRSPLRISDYFGSLCHICDDKFKLEVNVISKGGPYGSVSYPYRSTLPTLLQTSQFCSNANIDIAQLSKRCLTNDPQEQQYLKVFNQLITTMEFTRIHLISHLLLVMISSAASLTFNLTNIGPQNQNVEIITEGDGAYISDGGIQVTPDGIGSDQNNKTGRATYFRPLHLWDRESNELASFTTNFTFVIDSNRNQFYADGLTFFLAQNNSEIYNGGSMGLPINGTAGVNTTTQFVAVEFDTFWNTRWDPLNSSNSRMGDHVGISISSLRSVRTQKWLSNVTGGGVCQAWITYNSASRNLSVSFTGFQNNTVIRQDGLHYVIDLKDVLPEWVIFGFSAATGARFEKNNVRSWSFNSSELQVDKNNEPPVLPPINNSKIGLIVGLLVGITFLGVVALLLWRRKKKTREVEAEETGFDIEMDNEFEMGTGPKRFTYHELAQATGDFGENEKLGEGGFGGVYRGFLKDSNTLVAVKRVSKSSKQGIKEYASEVRIISRLRHRNLVQLIGWCHQKGELLLV
ncbi:concanavalin A-like lectin/glucanase domain-containing protein [Artemisia annua]|uniref:non-specific serine/threonine protein kinase n=1 Tax=Artemisia annua TaxID=35608 RepID=A0A2U1P4F2_ARTAN|nr:concanavalin A-like lectin/glucanase domain-containing protein [Artemisia annua]